MSSRCKSRFGYSHKVVRIIVHSLRSQFMEFEHRNKVLYHCATYSKEHRRKRKRNKKWDYGDAEDAELNEFKVTSFIPIIDKLVAALNQRQAAYCVIRDRFGFLSELDSLVSDQMRDKANDLINIYSDDFEPGFVDEIVQFSALWNRYISSDSSKTEDTKQIREFQMFKMITRNALDAFPNMLITLRLYLSLMVTNCSGARSFSKLKRTKNELRSTMSQNRLNALSLLCIENELLQEIDVHCQVGEGPSKLFSSRPNRLLTRP